MLATTPAARDGDLPDEFPHWLRADALVLPMLPALAHRVIEMVGNPDLSIHTLAGLVAKDQVLAARVLGLANSAYSCPTQPITSVTEAIVRLGINAVRNVVVAVSFTSRLQDPAVYAQRGKPMVDHALGTAYVARLVAEPVGADVEEAFLCGLLHDIGKLVILKRAHEYRRHHPGALSDGEVDLALARHHPLAGTLVVDKWKLPESLSAPIRFHHDYMAAPADALHDAAVAYLANRLSHRYGFGCEPENANLLEDPVCALLDIDAAWLEATDVRAPGLFEVARQILA
jgi:putative nucleotidyltransferase with HDIG domain